MMSKDQGAWQGPRVVVAVAAPIEPGLAAAIQAVDDRLDVRYEPDLFPPLRFPGDHRGIDGFRRTQDQEVRWWRMLANAEVVLGVPGDTAQGLADLVRTNAGLCWVQTMATDEQVQDAGLSAEELDRVQITGAAGIHAGALAEFAMFALLGFAKQLPRLLANTRSRHWEQYPVSELAGQTLLVVGLGPAGAEVARLGKAFGMHVLAITGTGNGRAPNVDQLRPLRFLGDMLPVSHAVVLSLPLTEQTRGVIDARAITRMRNDAVLVNIGRGGVLDERALVAGLKQGRPAAAALDVFAAEPLPPESELWALPNFLLSPHTAAVSPHGNERITALFNQNLRCYLRGEVLAGRVRSNPSY